jgi:hypothetical protein
MTDNPPHLTDPPPPPRAFIIATAIFNIVALILLVTRFTTAGTAFVALAIVTGLISIFRGGPTAAGRNAADKEPPSRVG